MFGTTVGKSVGSKLPDQVKSTNSKKRKQPRFHDYLADYGGCGHWRLIWPQMIMNSTQLIVGSNTSSMILDPSFYKILSSVRVQRQVTPQQLTFFKHIRSLADKHSFRIIYEIDDIFILDDIPKYNMYRVAYDNPDVQKSGREIISMADEVTVTCDTMNKYYSQYNSNVTTIPNYPPRFWLANQYSKTNNIDNLQTNKKPRIMYSGSSAHFDIKNNNNGVDDVSHVVDFIRKTVDMYQWVFIGSVPPKLSDLFKSGKIEVCKWSNIYELPGLIRSLKINAFIAPLNDNVFNHCKSDIKLIESAAYGIPCISQDIITYENSPLKFKSGDDLGDVLKELFDDVDHYAEMCDTYNKLIHDRWLDDNIIKYIELYSHPYGDKQRKNLHS